MYSAIAARSASRELRGVADDLDHSSRPKSPLGVKPVFSTSAMSPFDQSPMPVWSGVMFGTEPLPSGLGPPAKRRSAGMTPIDVAGAVAFGAMPGALDEIGAAIPARGLRGIWRENLAVEEGELPQPEPRAGR